MDTVMEYGFANLREEKLCMFIFFVLILNAVYVERWHDILMNKIYAEELT